MKYTSWIAFCCLMWSLLAACSDEKEKLGEVKLKPERESVLFAQKGETKEIKVEATAEWGVIIPVEAREWCSATAMGNVLEITVAENNNGKARNTKLTLKNDVVSASVEVKQMGSEADIQLETKLMTLEGDQTTFSLEVGANVPYTIVIDESIDWIWSGQTETRTGIEVNTVDFILTRNTSGKKRTANIMFQSEDKTVSEVLRITQNFIQYEQGNVDNVGDYKLEIANATASQCQSDHPIQDSYDGNYQTYYHSQYTNGKLPVELTYNLAQPETLDYFVYVPRQDSYNGSWGRVEIWIKQNNSETFHKIDVKDFGQEQSYIARRYDFSTSQTGVTAIRFIIHDGYSDRASCAEVGLYQKNTELQEEMRRIFTNDLCEELKPGISQENISAINNSFLRQIAQSLLDGIYDKEYRIQEYEPYMDRVYLRDKVLKNGGHNLFENPTGICFEENEEVVVFVDDTQGEDLMLIIYDVDGNRRGLSANEQKYSLLPGVNKFKIDKGGLGYVEYFTMNWETAPKIKVHIASGKVNGYFDLEKHTTTDWQTILNNTTYGCIDMKGKYINLAFGVESLRQYCKDPVVLLEHYDWIVNKEYEVMGLIKYDKVPRNHMYARVTKDGMFADGKGAGFWEGSMVGLANSETCKTSAVWSVAHELGHKNQIAPDLKWTGTTELTNNIYSVCVRYELTPDNLNLEHEKVWDGLGDNGVCGGRFNSYLTYGVARGEQWFFQRGQDGREGYEVNGGDHFVKLCPLWQLLLYYRYIKGEESSPNGKMKDWYGDLAEIARTSGITSSSYYTAGEWQCKFMKDICNVLGQDLSDFYQKSGMLRVCDRIIGDYGGDKPLVITQAMFDDVVNTAKKYSKPETPVLYYLTANSYEAFEKHLPLQGTTNQGISPISNNYVTSGQGYLVNNSIWKNAVVFETYTNNELKCVAMVGTGVPGENTPRSGQTFVRYPSGSTAIYAVGWDGSRILVYGKSNGK